MGFEVGKRYRLRSVNSSEIRVLMQDGDNFIIEHTAGLFAFPSIAPGSRESAIFRVEPDKAIFWEEITTLRINWWLRDRYGRDIDDGRTLVQTPVDFELPRKVGVKLEPGDTLTWVGA
jgi:hypothetical protein